jgi:hypothetical protein
MRMPVKLNRAFWPKAISRILPSADDPRVLITNSANELVFTRAVSTFKFGSAFKSTGKKRFPLTLEKLAGLPFDRSPIVVDVGASDGITSMDIMKRISFRKYYVTDLNVETFYFVSGNYTFFYNPEGDCILAVTNYWIVYNDFLNAIFPFGSWARAFFYHAPLYKTGMTSIQLINPVLQEKRDLELVVEQYDVLKKWLHEKADLIIAGNILNRDYFSIPDLRKALKNLFEALSESGRLVIIDNRDIEKSTFFRLTNGKVEVEMKINNGTEIEPLIMDWFSAS